MNVYSYTPLRPESPITSLTSLHTHFCTVITAGERVTVSHTGLSEKILALVFEG
jgi:hypothetical protein